MAVKKTPAELAESRKKSNANLKPELGEPTRFKSGRQAVENGRKGGKARQAKYRETRTFREMVQEVLSYKPILTPALRDGLIKMGADPDNGDYSVGLLSIIACAQKSMKSDVGALQKLMEVAGQDPKVMLQQEMLQLERESLQQGYGGYSALDEAFEKMGDGSDLP